MYKERRIISASARRPLKAVRERDDSEGNDTMLMRGPNDWFVRPNRAGFRSNKSPTGTVNTISISVKLGIRLKPSTVFASPINPCHMTLQWRSCEQETNN
jgi:hypothetical protein